MKKSVSKLLKQHLMKDKINKPTLLVKHYNEVIGIEMETEEMIKAIVEGKLIIAPLEHVSGYGWVDSDLNVYHKDDPSVVVDVEHQSPSLIVKVRRSASISFFGKVLSNYRVTKLDTPSILNLIPLTHEHYVGDTLLKPGAINIHFDPMGENIPLPIYYKDGVIFSKHTVKKTTLERKTFQVQYNNVKYKIPFRDIMYQVLEFDYYARVLLYRYDNSKPFTPENCILQIDKTNNTYDKYLMTK